MNPNKYIGIKSTHKPDLRDLLFSLVSFIFNHNNIMEINLFLNIHYKELTAFLWVCEYGI